MSHFVEKNPPVTQRNFTRRSFTVDGFWTPQTFMLQAIQEWFFTASLPPASTALSIDKSPGLNEMLLACWPSLHITRRATQAGEAEVCASIPNIILPVCFNKTALQSS